MTAYKAGRQVNLEQILQHELMPVPISLASTNGNLHTGNKSLLGDLLTHDISPSTQITLTGTTLLVIDGQALVMTLGKPHGITTFGEYADVFVK